MEILERAHSALGPSGFERAENCTQSIPLSRHAPPRLAGPEAQAGTAAHALLERCLAEDLETFELGGLDKVKVDGHEVEITPEMLDDVTLMLDWVRANMPGPLLLEQRVDFPEATRILGAPVFGTLDIGTEQGPPWMIADAKFGWGFVSEASPQLGLYLLGLALKRYPNLEKGPSCSSCGGELGPNGKCVRSDYKIGGDNGPPCYGHDRSKPVDLSLNGLAGTVAVLQPNANSEPIRTKEYSWSDLRDLHGRLLDTARRVRQERWSYKAGSWCRYCPAAGICPHLHAMARDPAMTAISPSPELVASGEMSKEHLEDLLDRAEILDHAIRQLHATAESYLVHGGKLRNRKLVRKKTNRRWIGEAEAVTKLTELGVDPYKDPVVVSPNEAEKRLPRSLRKVVNEELAEKPVGELTMVAADDSRSEIDVSATLRRALEQSVAMGQLAAVPGVKPGGEKAKGKRQKAKGER